MKVAIPSWFNLHVLNPINSCKLVIFSFDNSDFPEAITKKTSSASTKFVKTEIEAMVAVILYHHCFHCHPHIYAWVSCLEFQCGWILESQKELPPPPVLWRMRFEELSLGLSPDFRRPMVTFRDSGRIEIACCEQLLQYLEWRGNRSPYKRAGIPKAKHLCPTRIIRASMEIGHYSQSTVQVVVMSGLDDWAVRL
ncbi:hypothetical protein ACOSQ4_022133 [Xanthoceras sorbifolium]